MTGDGSTELLLRSMLDAITELRHRVMAIEHRMMMSSQTQPSIFNLLDVVPTVREMVHGLLWFFPRAVMGFGFIEGWWASVWHWVLVAIKGLL